MSPPVLRVEAARKVYGEVVALDGVSLDADGEILGLIGANGAGKSTLFNMIAGEEKPDAGEIRLGETVELSYVDQSRDALDGEKRVWEVISDGEEYVMLGKREVAARAYASWFNFTGADQQKRVKALSGGERNRVHLARTLKAGGNVLLLDEPTNDLDVETLRALESALEARAAVTALVHARSPRASLAQILASLPATEGATAHVAAYHGVLRALVEEIEDDPDRFPTIDRGHNIAQQLDALTDEQVRELGRRLVGRF